MYGGKELFIEAICGSYYQMRGAIGFQFTDEMIDYKIEPKFDLPCEHFETTNVWVETDDGRRLTKPMYKGIDCEKMYQEYIKTKAFEKEVKDLNFIIGKQRIELKSLRMKYDKLKNFCIKAKDYLNEMFEDKLPF